MEWIIPANLKYYDVFGEIKHFGKIEWRQHLKNISVGDIVYIYLSSPERYIAFKCIVEKTNITKLNCSIDDKVYFKDDTLRDVPLYMLLKSIKEFAPTEITGKMIADAGIPRIQSQRSVCPELYNLIQSKTTIQHG